MTPIEVSEPQATGRLLAELMTGETPFADPGPYSVERFG